MTTDPPDIIPLGESALLLRWQAQCPDAANRQVHAARACLADARPAWVHDIVPGVDTLAIHLDIAALMAAEGLTAVDDPLAHAGKRLGTCLQSVDPQAPTLAALVTLPVCYGGVFGPDLASVATHAGLTPEAVVARHSAATYQVAMLGFAPGFAYLLGLDACLRVPRLATPRTRVPAGSLGIGGDQTGLYPHDGPGGWQLIGRTPQRLFDPAHTPPCTLAPGDRVRFTPVSADDFSRLAQSPCTLK